MKSSIWPKTLLTVIGRIILTSPRIFLLLMLSIWLLMQWAWIDRVWFLSRPVTWNSTTLSPNDRLVIFTGIDFSRDGKLIKRTIDLFSQSCVDVVGNSTTLPPSVGPRPWQLPDGRTCLLTRDFQLWRFTGDLKLEQKETIRFGKFLPHFTSSGSNQYLLVGDELQLVLLDVSVPDLSELRAIPVETSLWRWRELTRPIDGPFSVVLEQQEDENLFIVRVTGRSRANSPFGRRFIQTCALLRIDPSKGVAKIDTTIGSIELANGQRCKVVPDSKTGEPRVWIYSDPGTLELRSLDDSKLLRTVDLKNVMIESGYSRQYSFSSDGKYFIVSTHSSGPNLSIDLEADDPCHLPLRTIALGKRTIGGRPVRIEWTGGSHPYLTVTDIESNQLRKAVSCKDQSPPKWIAPNILCSAEFSKPLAIVFDPGSIDRMMVIDPMASKSRHLTYLLLGQVSWHVVFAVGIWYFRISPEITPVFAMLTWAIILWAPHSFSTILWASLERSFVWIRLSMPLMAFFLVYYPSSLGIRVLLIATCCAAIQYLCRQLLPSVPDALRSETIFSSQIFIATVAIFCFLRWLGISVTELKESSMAQTDEPAEELDAEPNATRTISIRDIFLGMCGCALLLLAFRFMKPPGFSIYRAGINLYAIISMAVCSALFVMAILRRQAWWLSCGMMLSVIVLALILPQTEAPLGERMFKSSIVGYFLKFEIDLAWSHALDDVSSYCLPAMIAAGTVLYYRLCGIRLVSTWSRSPKPHTKSVTA